MDCGPKRIVGCFGVRCWRLRCLYVLLLASASSCCVPTSLLLLLSEEAGRDNAPGRLGEINQACWDAASLAVVEAHNLRVADNVGAFWDFMTYLCASPQPKHQELFMKLAQLFWQRYVNCVLARAHGMGRRASLSKKRATDSASVAFLHLYEK